MMNLIDYHRTQGLEEASRLEKMSTNNNSVGTGGFHRKILQMHPNFVHFNLFIENLLGDGNNDTSTNHSQRMGMSKYSKKSVS